MANEVLHGILLLSVSRSDTNESTVRGVRRISGLFNMVGRQMLRTMRSAGTEHSSPSRAFSGC